MTTYKSNIRLTIDGELARKLIEIQKKVEKEIGIRPSIPKSSKILGKMLKGKKVTIKKKGRRRWTIEPF